MKEFDNLSVEQLQSQLNGVESMIENQLGDAQLLEDLKTELQLLIDQKSPQQVIVNQPPANMINNPLFQTQLQRNRTIYKNSQARAYAFMIEIVEIKLNENNRPTRTKKFDPARNSRVYRPDESDVAEAILNLFDLAIDKHGIVYIYDQFENRMIYQFNDFVHFIGQCTTAHLPNSTLKINDINTFTKLVYNHLKQSPKLRQLTQLPTKLVATNNGLVIDLETKEKYPVDEVSKFYDIMSISPRNYIDMSTCEPDRRNKSILNRKIAQRIIDEWGSKIEGLSLLLMQCWFAAIEGWNRGKFAVLKGAGGNGKSTYMEMAANLAGEKHTAYININQWSDNNILNLIGPDTHVMIGDDAPTHAKVSDKSLSNLKSITTGQSIITPVKFEPSKVVHSTGLYLQGTNTDVRVFENSQAIKSRMMLINWIDTNFRELDKSLLDFDLDELKNDPDFMDDLFSWVIDNVEYFLQFSIPQESIDALDRMVEDEDSVQQILNDLEELCSGVTVPYSYAYEYLKLKTKRENPGSAVMKMQTFTKRLKELSSNSSVFTTSDERRHFRPNSRDKEATMAETSRRLLGIGDVDLLDKSLSLKPLKQLTQSELNKFQSTAQNLASSLEPLNSRQEQILDHLLHTTKNTEIISLFNDAI